ncbi:hypothetical protein L9F63_002908 [Diploptera punctata]|uniref:lysozyme n=1 Tax=Diploptera punctata TaxID=6984 RepID=A0AAD7ZT06_DIPPU|nr:hypothetical protein L9F63_002908 [Diploptera punctata]
MASGRLLLAIAAVICCTFYVVGQNQPVSEICLGCICEAVSNCNSSARCSGDVCGLFKITWAYWADAGKPILNGDDVTRDGAYSECAIDPFCAASTVQAYMQKFGKDCNGDGVVNCFDFAKIHRLGGYGCEGNLDYNYQNRFMECLRQVQQLTGSTP